MASGDACNPGEDGNSNKEITIVLAGKSGAGKSTLIDNLLNQAKGVAILPDRNTDEIVQISTTRDGVIINMIDTPGPETSGRDTEKQLRRLARQTDGKVNLLVYCVPVSPANKFEDSNPKIMKSLHKAYGKEIWQKCVLVFTFSDDAKRTTDRMKGNAEENYKDYIRKYTAKFQDELRKELKVKNISVESILDLEYDRKDLSKVIVAAPAGFDNTDKVIPNREENWTKILFAIILTKSGPKNTTISLELLKVIEELEERVQEAERRAIEAEKRAIEVERRSRAETSQWERKLQTSEERAREAERRQQEAERRLQEEEERRLRKESSQWERRQPEVKRKGENWMEKVFYYTGNSESKKVCGFQLHIPEYALPPGVEQIPVSIKAAANCDYTVPVDAELVSGVYSITTSCTFTKPVTLEIEHSSLLESPGDTDSLFIGKSTDDTPPYNFQPMEGAIFKPNEKIGTIISESSPIIATFRNNSRNCPGKNSYTASLYYSVITQACSWNVYFVVIKNLQIIQQCVRNYFQENGVNLLPEPLHRSMTLESEKIELLAPEVKEFPSGWRLERLTEPMIFRSDVDSYTDDSNTSTALPPHCHFQLTCPPDCSNKLGYKLELRGASPSFIKITNPKVQTSSRVQIGDEGIVRVNKKLKPAAHKWKEIGSNLGFTFGELSNIEGRLPNMVEGPGGCLREMLSQWQQWAPGDARGSGGYATMEDMKDAVDHAGFGCLAQELL